jgi:hypothetical protein
MKTQQKRILTAITLNSVYDNKFLIEVLKTTFYMIEHNIRLKIHYKIEKFFGIKKPKKDNDKIW